MPTACLGPVGAQRSASWRRFPILRWPAAGTWACGPVVEAACPHGRSGAWPAATNLGGAVVPPDSAGGLASHADEGAPNLLSFWILQKKRCPSAFALRALSRPRHVQARTPPGSC
jgi:hypothetical protein